MNIIDTLKKKPVPKGKKTFKIFFGKKEEENVKNIEDVEKSIEIPIEKEEEKEEKTEKSVMGPDIIDKRGKVSINRDEIMERLKKFKTKTMVVQEEKDETTNAIVTDVMKDETSDIVVEKAEPIVIEPTVDEEREEDDAEEKKIEEKIDKKDDETEVADKDDEIKISEMPVVDVSVKKRGRKPKEGVFDQQLINSGIEKFKKNMPQIGDKILVKSSSYYMNNRKIFVKKINELFKDYLKEIQSSESGISCNSSANEEFSLLTHQKIVRDYLNIYTPYRGLLLYHGLGSGKTCSSIALAEGMKSDKKIVVMTPASLKMNFFSELKKCGDLLFKKNQYWEFVSIDGKPEYVEILHKTMSISKEYIRKRGGCWMVNVKKEPNFPTLTTEQQKEIDLQLNEMIRVKYLDLNYNGLTKKAMDKLTGNDTRNPFDNCVLIIDEAHNFVSRIVNKLKNKKSTSYKLYEYIMNATNAKVILLTGTPIINYPNEISILFNMLRGYIKSWTFNIKVKSDAKINKDAILEMFDKEGFNTFDFIEYSGNKLQITRNPFGFINTKKRDVLRGTKKVKGGDDKKENINKENINKENINKENINEDVNEENVDLSETELQDDGDFEEKGIPEQSEETTDEDISEEELNQETEEGEVPDEDEEEDENLAEKQKEIADKQQSTIAELKDKVTRMEEDLVSIQEKNKILEKALVDKTVEAHVSELSDTPTEEKDTEIESEEAEIEPSDDTEEEEDAETEEKDKETTDDDIETLKGNIRGLEYDIYSIKKRNDELEEQLKEQQENQDTSKNYNVAAIIDKQYNQEQMIEEQKKIIETQREEFDKLKLKLDELKGQYDKLDENDEIRKERIEMQKEQEKELQKQIKEMEKTNQEQEKKLEDMVQDTKKKDTKEKEEDKLDATAEEEESLYGRFEKGIDTARDYINKQLGIGDSGIVGGARKTKKANRQKTNTQNSSNKRKTQKVQKINIIPKIEYKEEEIEDEASARMYYQMGNNQIYNPYYGGNGALFDKYNGVKLDSTGNISDDEFMNLVIKILKKNKLEVNESNIQIDNYKSLPDNPVIFNELFISEGSSELKNVNLLKRRILGLTSYFRSAQEQLMPSIVKTGDNENIFIVKTPMSDHQFSEYQAIRKKEAEEEKRNKKNKGKEGMVDKNGESIYNFSSTYKIFSRAACNFAFPEDIERPKPSMDSKGEVREDNFDGVKKKEIMNRDDYNPEDDEDIKEDMNYQKRLTKSLKELGKKNKQGSYVYLNVDSLKQYSPKFLALLSNINHPENTGMHLIYSQFRTLEGIGILKMILNANGYAEFKIKKNTATGKWTIVQNIGDEEKSKYVLYTGSETAEEKEIIRNIYNSNWKLVPESIVSQIEKTSKHNHNGEIIKIFMITASGAEGISLKNTRFVHIVEPYWHMVRTDQVIGRARRICSHEDLPKSLRTVKVYLYLSTLTEEQSTSDKNTELRIRDTSKIDGVTPVTTDEMLYEISYLKNNINKQILNAVKSTSFDCNLYATKRNEDEAVACYKFGKVESNDYTGHPNIDVDKTYKDELNIKKITWKAQQITYRRKDYALNTETNEIYDMESYNNAVEGLGDLIKVGQLETDRKGKPKFVFNK